ncbi:MAG TPA: ribose-5-phosphate isomerase RpiA [Chloroflexaceae bacterium]|nr:ribose-5-phosphate isomerase RpiA [Chloroflexaceae bacterium]
MDEVARDELKRLAAERAVELVRPGMVVGLGYGSTAVHAVRRIAALLDAGELREIVGVPCAAWTEAEARRLGIPLATLDERPAIDLTIDGADEVDPRFNLIKGGGGALLREKMVAQASAREVIVVDAAKLVPALGAFPLPVEVVQFGWGASARFLAGLGARVSLRRSGDAPFVTDQGNYILDCAFGAIADPGALARALEGRAGIVEHGLFLGLATDVIVADAGGVRHLRG